MVAIVRNYELEKNRRNNLEENKWKLSKIHHIAIIGTDYNKTTDFYINKLKFEKISEYNRPEKNDILLNVKKGDIVLEIFYKRRCPN